MIDTEKLRILAFGDVVGRPGRSALKVNLPELLNEFNPDLVIANGENAAGGTSPDELTAKELLAMGINIITLGDHTWQKREFRDFLNSQSRVCIRPANYPEGAPGRGATIWEGSDGVKVGIVNLIGRVFIGGALDCPFRKFDSLRSGELADCKIIIVDFHAEATSEKWAMGRYIDGRASLLFGTHTHVQTADDQILPCGTGYISDLGMCGSSESVIGMDSEVAMGRFLNGLPSSYKVGKGEGSLRGIFVEVDKISGKTVSICRIELPKERRGQRQISNGF